MRKKGRVWQLRVKNSPAEEAATGKRYTVHSLGRDTAKAIAQAERYGGALKATTLMKWLKRSRLIRATVPMMSD